MNVNMINGLIEEANTLLKPSNNEMLCKNSVAGNRLIKVLSELADEMLLYKDGIVLCKYQYLLLWRKYTISLESDLPVIVFLANQSIQRDESINKFDWKLVIDHDNEELNHIFRQGMADNHYHLGGSLPIFQCIWTDLMTKEPYRKNIKSLFLDEYKKIEKAVCIRQYFVKFMLNRNRNLTEDVALEGIEKYYEERKFLYYIIRELIQDGLEKIQLEGFLYNYLIIKEWVRELVVQCGNNIGENAFFSINNNKTLFLKYYNNLGEIIKTSVNEQIRSSCIKYLEIRVKMQDSAYILYKYIKYLDSQINCSDVEVRYIICFSRKMTVNNDIQYRNQSKIVELRKQMEDFNAFLVTYPGIAKQVIGIDVCSKESNYKPDVFSEIMCSKKNTRLKRMYHVGERYSDLLSGLRSVDECIHFFELKSGDRLGHAVPVFEKVDEWYKERENQITISKEEYLDNMAWLYCDLPPEIRESKDGEKIIAEFYRFFGELYQNAFMFNTILEFYCRQNIEINIYNVTIFHYLEAWKLRKEKPEKIKEILLNCCFDENKAIIYYIAYCYFYNIEVKNRGCEKIYIHITNEMITLIRIMQSIIQNKISRKGICIEVCPSSNILLGNVKKGYCHPLINLLEKTKENLKEFGIRISINTDDQGIFATSLMSEYSLLINAFENERDNNGDMKFKRNFLYQWIDKIRENSIQI